MRFLLSVIDSSTDSATPEEMAEIDAFNHRLRENGNWVLAGGISPPATARVIDNRGGKGETLEGPLHSSAEYVSGFWIIEAPDFDAAREIASEGSRCFHRKVELRSFLGE